MRLKEIDFSSLEIKEIGAWPLILRVAVLVAAAIVTVILMFFLIFMSELEALSTAEQNLETKKKEFQDQYTMAVNVDAYQAQMKQIEEEYDAYIKQLPASSNIPELIDSLTKIGERNNLFINSIKLGDPKLIADFYMELPLTISVVGGYHNIGLFVNETAKLSRIVTLHDFTLKRVSDVSNDGMLQMDMQALTYWLASKAEIESQQVDAPTGKKGKGAKGAPKGAAADANAPANLAPPGMPDQPPVPGDSNGPVPMQPPMPGPEN